MSRPFFTCLSISHLQLPLSYSFNAIFWWKGIMYNIFKFIKAFLPLLFWWNFFLFSYHENIPYYFRSIIYLTTDHQNDYLQIIKMIIYRSSKWLFTDHQKWLFTDHQNVCEWHKVCILFLYGLTHSIDSSHFGKDLPFHTALWYHLYDKSNGSISMGLLLDHLFSTRCFCL